MKTPDITIAQVLAAVKFLAGVLVALHWADGGQADAIIAGAAALAAVMVAADAAIRRKRAEVFGAAMPTPFPDETR